MSVEVVAAAGTELAEVEWSETGLSIPLDTTFEQWEHLGSALGRFARAHQWWVGDWLNFGEQVYGEKYSQALAATGMEYSTVANWSWVANAIKPSVRTELSWSHHKQVANLDPDDQTEWLERADANEWSANELRKQLKNDEPTRVQCPTCGSVVRANKLHGGRENP